MSRIRYLLVAVPALLVGGLVFPHNASYADVGSRHGYWSDNLVAQVDPQPARPRVPAPPAPPAPPRHGGVSVSIHDGKVQIDGVKDMVTAHIQQALDAVRNMKDIPADVRTKLEKRLEKVQKKLEKRLAHLDATDVDQLGDELGKMGDEIGKEMDEFGKEMEKYGEKMGKDFGKDFGKNFHGNMHMGSDVDDDSDQVVADSDPDDADVDLVVQDLGDLSLKPQQRDAIQRLHAESDRQVATAKKALDQASTSLKHQLDNPASNDADIARAIDAVSQQEAAIRKARILAWHSARRMLDDAQRQQVQDAAKKHH